MTIYKSLNGASHKRKNEKKSAQTEDVSKELKFQDFERLYAQAVGSGGDAQPQLDAFDSRLKELSTNLGKFETDTTKSIGEINSALTSTQNEVQNLTVLQTETNEKVAALEQSQNTIQTNLSSLQSAHEDFQKETSANFEKLQTAQQDFEKKTNASLENLQSAQQTFEEEANANFDSLQQAQQKMQEQVSALLDFQSSVTSQLALISNQISNITDVLIPDLEGQIGQGGGGGGDEDIQWTTLYDKDSSDPALNKGEPGGLYYDNQANILPSLDFSPYNYVRFTFRALDDPYYYIYNLKEFPEQKSYIYIVTHLNDDASCLTGAAIVRRIQDDGSIILAMKSIHRSKIKTSSISWKSVDDMPYYFSKIEVR